MVRWQGFALPVALRTLAGNHGPAWPGKAALLAAEHGCLHGIP